MTTAIEVYGNNNDKVFRDFHSRYLVFKKSILGQFKDNCFL